MHATASTMADPVDLTLPFAAESAHSPASTWCRGWTSLSLNDEDRDDARLVISELVGNAVRHARPLDDDTVQIAWNDGPAGLDISVTDGGARTTPERVDAGLSDLSGRGLAIVETLATRWWVETTRSRTTVHALVALA